ncbi:lipopolysaccharide biosynthesis protein [Compostibacter hankyongensis]|uniref:Polysaccharide biosynthesis C-terminal domain-containing protein n=1 Tax=Compostibacter hankyongensis TaxID=1007089 RepID=A0ABP8FEG2_9BACT
MSSIRRLANQTLWYGGSYVAARFLNVFLKFFLTHIIAIDNYGVVTKVYVYSTFLNVLFTYGMETTYFRFIQHKEGRNAVYATSFFSVFGTTILLSTAMAVCAAPISDIWNIPGHPEWVVWFAGILGFDALCAIPFARLRQQGRPVKYAFIRFLNILMQVLLIFYFLVIGPWAGARGHRLPGYDPAVGVGYVFIANLIASAVTLLLLYKELRGLRAVFDLKLWKQMMRYTWPLMIVGFGGMINEVMDRALLDNLLPYSRDRVETIQAIYYSGYLFALLINVFIQVFKMGAEPFFFNEAGRENAQATYARIMKFYVIGSCWMFLGIVLFRDLWKALNLVDIRHSPEYAGGFDVIPQLAMSYVCLGIYYNLAIWYKLTNKTLYGAYMTLAGVVVTLVLNIWWIPRFSYVGSAWASFLCYFIMMVISFVWGQRHYPVPYEWKKLGGYMLLAVVVLLLHEGLQRLTGQTGLRVLAGVLLLGAYMLFTLLRERREFSRLPVVGRWLGR